MSGSCFYCNNALLKRGSKRKNGIHSHPHARTTDHIVPQNLLREFGITGNTHPSWSRLNHVPCCYACNNRKGDMWPLDWLAILPHEIGVKRLSQRLLLLGCPQAELDAVLHHRKNVAAKKKAPHVEASTQEAQQAAQAQGG